MSGGATPRRGRPVSQPCGTRSAAVRHRRRGEPVCEACRRAEAEHQAAMYAGRRDRR